MPGLNTKQRALCCLIAAIWSDTVVGGFHTADLGGSWLVGLSMKRKRLLFFTVVLSMVVVCVAAFLLTRGSSGESTITFSDGSSLTLRGITKGTKHRYVSGSLLQRTADRILPERWTKK